MKLLTGIEQGTPAWFAARLGIPTASNFDSVMTPKTRKLSASWKKYACRLIAERITKIPTETVEGQEWMERGKELEPVAAAQYEFVNDVKLVSVAFATNDAGTYGCSPDRVIFEGDRIVRAVEVKAPALHTHLYYQHFIGADEAYATQVQGQMLVLEIDENELYSYYPGGPAVSFKVNRDDGFITDLAKALGEFNDRLNDLYEATLKMGEWVPAAKTVMAPVDVEYAEPTEDQLWFDRATSPDPALSSELDSAGPDPDPQGLFPEPDPLQIDIPVTGAGGPNYPAFLAAWKDALAERVTADDLRLLHQSNLVVLVELPAATRHAAQEAYNARLQEIGT